jgi:transcription elongation factor Elf1
MPKQLARDMECPYCGEQQYVFPQETYFDRYDEDHIYEQQCEACDKAFAFRRFEIVQYEAHKADCLNGAEHPFQPTHTHPVQATEMECPDCGRRRPCTDEELLAVIQARLKNKG